MRSRTYLLGGSFFVLVGILDFLNFNNTALTDIQRHLLAHISSHRGYGTHYVTILVGNPPQSLRLAVATGSAYTAFPCQGCDTCREPHFHYSAENAHKCPSECLYKEATCQEDQDGCYVTVTYAADNDLAGAGYKGFEVTDYVFVDIDGDVNVDVASEVRDFHPDITKQEGFPLHFICQEQALGGAELSDGYLGMSTAPLSFLNQLHDAGKINERMFSLCFQDYDDYQPAGASAGHVTFGHVDRDLLDSPLVWAANTGSAEKLSSYAVHIRRVYLGIGGGPDFLKSACMGTMSIMLVDGNSDDSKHDNLVDYRHMNGESGVVVIQTNQPTSYLHSSIEDAFKSAFYSITGMQYAMPAFAMTEKQFAKLPTVFIQLEV